VLKACGVSEQVIIGSFTVSMIIALSLISAIFAIAAKSIVDLKTASTSHQP